MKKRKIDDAILLEMVNEGKEQKEIAEYFGVSPSAVCQRVQRLLPQMPESFEKLTPQQQKFVISKLEGKTNTQSAMDSYECTSLESAKAVGSNLMNNPKVTDAIAEMTQQGLTMHHRIGRLKYLIDHRDPNVVHKGLDMSFKLDGSYQPEKSMALNLNIEISDEERAELEELARMLAQKAVEECHRKRTIAIEASKEQEENDGDEGG